jgi:hypothetical protein
MGYRLAEIVECGSSTWNSVIAVSGTITLVSELVILPLRNFGTLTMKAADPSGMFLGRYAYYDLISMGYSNEVLSLTPSAPPLSLFWKYKFKVL